MFCSNCGAEMKDAARFCPKCGTPVRFNQAPAPEPDIKSKTAQKAETGSKAKSSAKAEKIKILLISILIIIAVVTFLVVNLIPEDSDVPVLYIADGELYYGDLSDDDSDAVQITNSMFADSGGDIAAFIFSHSNSTGGSSIVLTNDYLFYPDNIDPSDDSYTLCYKELTGRKDAEGKKIASNITWYAVSEDGNIVTYVQDSVLCNYNVSTGERNQVAHDIRDVAVSDDGYRVVYTNDHDRLVLWETGQIITGLAKSVTCLDYASDDCSMFLYEQDGALYVTDDAGNSTWIADNILYILEDSITENGAFYYVTNEEITVAASVHVIDDIAASDDTEISIVLRDAIEALNYTYTISTLCYYDGSESCVVASDYIGYEYMDSDGNLFFSCRIRDTDRSLALSEISSVSDVTALLSDIYGSWPTYDNAEDYASHHRYLLAADGTAVETGLEDGSIWDVEELDGAFYIMVSEDSSGYDCALWKVTLSDGSCRSVFIDEDVYSMAGMGSELVYLKNYSNGSGDLCAGNSSVIETGVYSIIASGDDGLLCFKNYNSDDNTATLCILETGEGGSEYLYKWTELSDSVPGGWHSSGNTYFYICPAIQEGHCAAFLYDYDSSEGEGDLIVYNGETCSTYASDVNILLTPSEYIRSAGAASNF